jgi:hypothetical protein
MIESTSSSDKTKKKKSKLIESSTEETSQLEQKIRPGSLEEMIGRKQEKKLSK